MEASQRTTATHMLHGESRLCATWLGGSLSTTTTVGADCNNTTGESPNASAGLALDSHYSQPYRVSSQPQGPQNPTEKSQPCANESVLLSSSITLEVLGLPSSDLPPPRSSTFQDLIILSPRLQPRSPGDNAANHLTLPPRFYPDPVISGSTIKFILSLYEPIFEFLAFRPVPGFSEKIRKELTGRIQASSLAHWSRYLGAKILQTLLQGGEEADLRAYNPWFERMDKLCITSRNDTILEDLIGRLSGGLELSYLKFITSDVNAGYSLLKKIAPTFMKVAFADPSLWPRHPNSSGISLVHTLASHSFELARFVFMDTLLSFTFGVPPLVEYDTSCPATEVERHHVRHIETMHGYPVEFVMGIIKINIWRARRHDTPVKHTWEEIEADILGWNPQPDDSPPGNSWKSVARLAIQEAWRHAGLIYLYMGVCEVTSHDPRVQSSVRQIMNMLDVMQFDDPVCIHFLLPCFVAGICVRGEKQRASIRNSITQSKNNTAWLFRKTDVVLVLEHLWHGRAANGGAVTWEDYVSSRRANIRID